MEVPGRSLTPGFTKTYLDANHPGGLAMDEVRKDAALQATLSKITSIRCERGKVVAVFGVISMDWPCARWELFRSSYAPVIPGGRFAARGVRH